MTAANGFQAWKILEDAMNHIDLVLTEVVMPCLSGIGLLCNIMNHKTLKNIPVISEYFSWTPFSLLANFINIHASYENAIFIWYFYC